MDTQRINCWEQRKCKVYEGCPAYPDQGRICFSVTGTLCRGETQGNYFKKIKMCKEQCEFIKMINPEFV